MIVQELLDKILSDDFSGLIADRQVLKSMGPGAAAASAPFAGPLPSDSSPVQKQRDTRRWQRGNRPQEAGTAGGTGAAAGLHAVGDTIGNVVSTSGGSTSKDSLLAGDVAERLGASVSFSLTDSSLEAAAAAGRGAAARVLVGRDEGGVTRAAGGTGQGDTMFPSWLRGSGESSEITLPSTVLAEQLTAAVAAVQAGGAAVPPAAAATGTAAAAGGGFRGVHGGGRSQQQQQQKASPSTSFSISAPSGLTTSSSSQGSVGGSLAAAMEAASAAATGAGIPATSISKQQQQFGSGRGRVRELVRGDVARTASPSSSLTSLPSTLLRGGVATGNNRGLGGSAATAAGSSASVSSGASINALLEELLSLADTLPIEDGDHGDAPSAAGGGGGGGGRGTGGAPTSHPTVMGFATSAGVAGEGSDTVSSESEASGGFGVPHGLLDSVLEAWLVEEMGVGQGQQQQRLAGAAGEQVYAPSSSSVLSLPTTVVRQLGEQGVQWQAYSGAAVRSGQAAGGGRRSSSSSDVTLPTTVVEAQPSRRNSRHQQEMQERNGLAGAGAGGGVTSPDSSVSLPSTLATFARRGGPGAGELGFSSGEVCCGHGHKDPFYAKCAFS
jgi:hypothetical protein